MSSKGERKYELLAQSIRNDIASGRLSPGEKLPTIKDLRQEGHAPDTVREAMRVLKREGLVEGGQGQQAIVARKRAIIARSASYVTLVGDGKRRTWRQEMADLGMIGRQVLGRVGEASCPEGVAERLGVEPGATVIVRPRIMLADDEPVQLADSYYPLSLASGTPLARQSLVRGGIYSVLDAAGLESDGCEEGLTFPLATEDDCKRLGVRMDDRVVRMVRSLYLTDGRTIAVDVMTLRADRHQLTYRLSAQS